MKVYSTRNLIITSTVLFVMISIFAGGFISGAYYYDVYPNRFQIYKFFNNANEIEINQKAANTPKELKIEFEPFWESFELLQENFVDQPLDTTKLVQGAIRGMLKATGDKNTNYMTPIEQNMMSETMRGEVEGIGAEVDTSGDYLRVISPLPGSPAEKAGLLPGDIIISVDGNDMTGIAGFEVISKVRGPAGTTVTITIQRENIPDPITLDIVRYNFSVSSVESKQIDNQLVYVKINRFGEKTKKELRDQLNSLSLENATGLILDLRNNPGGFLDAGIAVTSEFINDRTIMIEEFGNGSTKEYKSDSDGIATNIPLVLLVNRGSASASEIVASAVKDYNRGSLVGENTYGKGTVQTWVNLSNDKGSVRITFARWKSPLGRSIDGTGVAPDFLVQNTYENGSLNDDNQLNYAIQYLSSNS